MSLNIAEKIIFIIRIIPPPFFFFHLKIKYKGEIGLRLTTAMEYNSSHKNNKNKMITIKDNDYFTSLYISLLIIFTGNK